MKKIALHLLLWPIFSLMFIYGVFPKCTDYLPVASCTNKVAQDPDEIVVQFNSKVTDEAIQQVMGRLKLVKKRTSYKPGKFTVFKNNDPLNSLENIISQLKKEPFISRVEKNYLAYKAMSPNDKFFSPLQWNFKRIGVERAWDRSTGASVIVAVLDTGIKQSLEDLSNTHFVAGYDFINHDNDPTDDEGHGSHVCGTIAQSTNNHLGVAGIAYHSIIMPLKVLDSDGCGRYTQIADGIYWAVDHGAQIINMSFSGMNNQGFLKEAIDYAWSHGALLVCAAGNNKSGVPEWPAAYQNCISVSSSAGNDRPASYSNFGSTIDLCAPGGDTGDFNNDQYEDMILQNAFTSSGDGYYFFAGTSMSAAHVSGVAALVYSVNPVFSNTLVREILEKSAEDIGAPGKDSYFGYGMVDAYGAVKLAEKYSRQIFKRQPGGKNMEHRKSSQNYSM